MNNKLARGFAAATLAASSVALNTGCASLNSQNLPSDPCGKAGVVPVKVEGASPQNTFIANDRTRYGLLDIHDPILQTRQETAVAGAGIGVVAAKLLKFHPVAGLLVGAVAGGAVGGAEGGASKTENMRQCFQMLNKGDYRDSTITIQYAGAGARFVNPNARQQETGRAMGYPAWIYENKR